MMHGLMIRLVFELGGDAFGPVAAAFSDEHGLDSGAEKRVLEQAFLPQKSSSFPFIIRGPIELEDFT